MTESASYGAPVSFQVDERVGLLVTDRWAWLFDPRGEAEPVAIEIDPLPRLRASSANAAISRCVPAPAAMAGCRSSCATRTPVLTTPVISRCSNST